MYPDAFGSASEICPSKMAARADTVELAMNHLIDQCLVHLDGSAKARKKVNRDTVHRAQGQQLEIGKNTSYAQRVNSEFTGLVLLSGSC